MLIFFLILGLTISIGFSIAAFILIRILLNRIKTYEMWIVEFKMNLIKTVKKMQDIDNQGMFATRMNDKGLFESTDEIGQIFIELKKTLENLNNITE